jgi:hypothetical protein
MQGISMTWSQIVIYQSKDFSLRFSKCASNDPIEFFALLSLFVA